MKLFPRVLWLLLLMSLPWGKQDVCAQNETQRHIDSLLLQLDKAGDDTNKILLLDDLSFSYYTLNPEAGLKYGQLELNLARSLKWEKGVALAYNSLGDNYLTRSNYPLALDYYFKAIKINETTGNELSLARNYNHVGVVYKQQKEYQRSLEYYFKALQINEAKRNKNGIALNLGNIANIYNYQGNYPDALAYNLKSLGIYRETGDSAGVGHVLGNIALLYKNKHEYPTAIDYYFKGLKIDESLSLTNEIDIKNGNIGDCYLQLAKGVGKEETQFPAAYANKKENLNKAIYYLKQGITNAKKINNLVDLIAYYKNLSEAQTLAGVDKDAFESLVQYSLLKDSVFSIENNEKILMIDYTRKRYADSLKTADEKRMTYLKLKHERNKTYIGISAIALLLGFSFFIVRERIKSEKLLLNILPAEVAAELKSKGVAKARYFNNVTVLFTDFANFNVLGEGMSPQELIDELNICFKAFDEITSRNKIEKIKTIGDSYLAIAGVPTANPLHAEQVIKAALEINAFMNDRQLSNRNNTFELRVGIHSGSVVAGIVGVKKFAYDIWGDTVNTAARMLQSGEPGKINISQTTYDLVKDKFNCTYRGAITAKNKGTMNMYFVETKPGT